MNINGSKRQLHKWIRIHKVKGYQMKVLTIKDKIFIQLSIKSLILLKI